MSIIGKKVVVKKGTVNQGVAFGDERMIYPGEIVRIYDYTTGGSRLSVEKDNGVTDTAHVDCFKYLNNKPVRF